MKSQTNTQSSREQIEAILDDGIAVDDDGGSHPSYFTLIKGFEALLKQSNLELLDRLGGELQGREKVLPSEHPKGLPLKNKSEMYCRGYNSAVSDFKAIIKRAREGF